MRTAARAVLCFAALAALLPLPARAGRTLVEPKAWAAAARALPKAALDERARAAGLPACTPSVVKSSEVQGLGCRVVAAAAAMQRRPLARPKDVAAQVEFAQALQAAARSTAELTPLVEPRPGFERRRFETHRATCAALLDVHDRLAQVAAGDGREAAQAALQSFGPTARPLKEAACGCVATAVTLGRAADAALDETGALQSVLTSRGCFLDDAKLRSERTPGGGVPADAAVVAAARSEEARIAAYARARDVGLARCRDKALASGRVKDAAKLEKCVCGEIGRWRFPSRAAPPSISVQLPVVEDRLVVDVAIDASGAAASCGPLSGSLVPASGS